MSNISKRFHDFCNREYKDKRIYKHIDKYKKKNKDSLCTVKTVYQTLVCYICGEKRVIDFCHIVSLKNGGTGDIHNLICLCPTHHRLFDKNLLNQKEQDKIKSRVDLAVEYYKLNQSNE